METTCAYVMKLELNYSWNLPCRVLLQVTADRLRCYLPLDNSSLLGFHPWNETSLNFTRSRTVWASDSHQSWALATIFDIMFTFHRKSRQKPNSTQVSTRNKSKESILKFNLSLTSSKRVYHLTTCIGMNIPTRSEHIKLKH